MDNNYDLAILAFSVNRMEFENKYCFQNVTGITTTNRKNIDIPTIIKKIKIIEEFNFDNYKIFFNFKIILGSEKLQKLQKFFPCWSNIGTIPELRLYRQNKLIKICKNVLILDRDYDLDECCLDTVWLE